MVRLGKIRQGFFGADLWWMRAPSIEVPVLQRFKSVLEAPSIFNLTVLVLRISWNHSFLKSSLPRSNLPKKHFFCEKVFAANWFCPPCADCVKSYQTPVWEQKVRFIQGLADEQEQPDMNVSTLNYLKNEGSFGKMKAKVWTFEIFHTYRLVFFLELYFIVFHASLANFLVLEYQGFAQHGMVPACSSTNTISAIRSDLTKKTGLVHESSRNDLNSCLGMMMNGPNEVG